MYHLLEKLLKKRGIKTLTELSEEESEDFDRWNKVLSEGEITVEKIIEFCKNQVNLIENQWKNMDNSQAKNERLILLHTVYKTILEAITAPKVEKERLESYLQQLLDSK